MGVDRIISPLSRTAIQRGTGTGQSANARVCSLVRAAAYLLRRSTSATRNGRGRRERDG
jgi:hypothetical protein